MRVERFFTGSQPVTLTASETGPLVWARGVEPRLPGSKPGRQPLPYTQMVDPAGVEPALSRV